MLGGGVFGHRRRSRAVLPAVVRAVAAAWATGWLPALGVGCGDVASPPFDGGGVAPRVQIGTGTSAFVELPASGGLIELVHGPQGGYHVELAARIWGLDPEALRITYRVVRRSDGVVLSATPYVLSPARVVQEGDHLLRTGDIAVLDVAGPMDVVSEDIELTLIARARDGNEASDTRVATVVDEMP
jgi:hypothetical protein